MENLNSFPYGLVHSVKLARFWGTNILKIIYYFSFNFTFNITCVSVEFVCFSVRLFGLLDCWSAYARKIELKKALSHGLKSKALQIKIFLSQEENPLGSFK